MWVSFKGWHRMGNRTRANFINCQKYELGKIILNKGKCWNLRDDLMETQHHFSSYAFPRILGNNLFSELCQQGSGLDITHESLLCKIWKEEEYQKPWLFLQVGSWASADGVCEILPAAFQHPPVNHPLRGCRQLSSPVLVA